MGEESLKHDKIYFRNLDSIRFFAALMVFFQHGMSASYKYLDIQGTILERFLFAISNGGTGVSIFFVLSGFLITYLILSEIELTGTFHIKKFYIRRILRIWPLYFAVVAIAFLIFPEISSLMKATINRGANLWYQLTFLSNFDVMHIEKLRPGTEVMMQNITWSVAIEEQFYAFWPLIFAFLPRRYFLPAILTVITGSLLFRLYHAEDKYILYFHTLAVMIDLATGALFAYLIIANAKVRAFFQRTNTWAILGLFLLFLITMMYGDIIFPGIAGAYLQRIFFALLFAFIIACQSMITKPSPLELGNIGFANKWGKYTYGIYLLHPIAIELVHITGKKLHLNLESFLPLFIMGLCSLLLTLLISWLSYEYYEKRFLRLKKTFAFITKE